MTNEESMTLRRAMATLTCISLSFASFGSGGGKEKLRQMPKKNQGTTKSSTKSPSESSTKSPSKLPIKSPSKSPSEEQVIGEA